MRRFVIIGLVLLSVGVALLIGRQWGATPAPAPIPEKAAARQLVVGPPADRAEPPRVAATAPGTTAAAPSTAGGTFRGRVIDAMTRQPLQEFEVQLVGVPRGHIRGNEPRVARTFQSTDGRFAWQQAPAGNWNVNVTAPRYQHFRVDGISIAAGKRHAKS